VTARPIAESRQPAVLTPLRLPAHASIIIGAECAVAVLSFEPSNARAFASRDRPKIRLDY